MARKRCKVGLETQSIMFDEKKWDGNKARRWLRSHDFKTPRTDRTASKLRYRQMPPSRCQRGTFRTIRFGSKGRGIQAVVCCPKRRKK